MFRDDFTYGGGGSTEYLTARSGWSRVAGSGADYNANVQVSDTALTSFPDSGPSCFLCTDQGTADHYVEVSVLNGCDSFVVIRATDVDNFIGFRYRADGSVQVFKFTTGGGPVQMGSDYSAGTASGQVCVLSGSGTTISFTIDGTDRCGSPFTGITENQSTTTAGVVTRTNGASPWIDYFYNTGGGGGSSIGPIVMNSYRQRRA